jgi:hypothetical protein
MRCWLVVEPSAIKSHVASILQKLGLRDRVQAVIAAAGRFDRPVSGLLSAPLAPARLCS